jgi:hypothetical protein
MSALDPAALGPAVARRRLGLELRILDRPAPLEDERETYVSSLAWQALAGGALSPARVPGSHHQSSCRCRPLAEAHHG